MENSKSSGSEVRVPMLIRVDRSQYNKFKAFSEVTGVPIVHLIREALDDFAATSLAARLEALQATRPDNVIPIEVGYALAATASQA